MCRSSNPKIPGWSVFSSYICFKCNYRTFVVLLIPIPKRNRKYVYCIFPEVEVIFYFFKLHFILLYKLILVPARHQIPFLIENLTLLFVIGCVYGHPGFGQTQLKIHVFELAFMGHLHRFLPLEDSEFKCRDVLSFSAGSVGKELICNAGDMRLIPGWERSPGEGNTPNPVQYSCLEISMDRGAWQVAVHGVTRVGHDLATKPK